MARDRRVGREKRPPGAADGDPATVLYLHSSDDLYGADIILLQIVTGLDRKRFTPIVVLPDDMRHVGLLTAKLAAHGVESMHLPLAIVRRRYLRLAGVLPLLRALLLGTWAVWRVAKRRNARIIHGFTLAVLSAPLAAVVCRLPLVMHAHEILERPKVLRKFLHWMGVRWSSRVICVSEATRQNILQDEPAAACIQVIHNGIKAAEKMGRSASELRAQLGVPVRGPLVGMIGRISKWKGQEVFLEAAALVAAKRPDCHFVSIGGVFDKETQHSQKLNELHRRLGLKEKVTLCGFLPDAREMLPAFDIFVAPSTSPDPFPTVILEAMCAGVPVIASAHGGPLEMVVDGVTGLLVPPRNPVALAEALTTLLGDSLRLRQMADAGRLRIEDKFALQPFLDRIQDVYTEVLKAEDS